MVFFCGPVFCCNETDTPGKQIVISQFSNNNLKGWEVIDFHKQTSYDIEQVDGINVLRVHSQGTASGLIYKKRIDLEKTPILSWRWRVDKKLENDHEQERNGDDFAARVYVVIDGGLLFWRSKALTYVWASHSPVGQQWWNPYANKSAPMIALRSGAYPSNTWATETRNVYADLKRIFGRPIRYIDAVAIMSDTDNTGASALAYYGDICFGPLKEAHPSR